MLSCCLGKDDSEEPNWYVDGCVEVCCRSWDHGIMGSWDPAFVGGPGSKKTTNVWVNVEGFPIHTALFGFGHIMTPGIPGYTCVEVCVGGLVACYTCDAKCLVS